MDPELPLFTEWYAALTRMLQLVQRFPKRLRPTLGQRLVDRGLDLMEQLVALRFTRERTALFARANVSLDQLRILLRLGHELRVISTGQYEQLADSVDACGRMLGGWRRAGAAP